MIRKHTIPFIELELADNLYIQIKDVSFIPSRPAYISGRPEDCYEAEGAECDWLKENAKLVIKKREMKESLAYYQREKKKVEMVTREYEFEVVDSFFYEYYDLIIEAIEGMEG